MKKSVYIETSVVSFLTARPTRDVIAAGKQEVTRRWWETRRHEYELVISQAVLDEAGRGDPEAARRRLEKLADLVVLETTEAGIQLADRLVKAHAIPPKAADDALHVAHGAVHGVHVLLTWNCTHIANAEKRDAIEATI